MCNSLEKLSKENSMSFKKIAPAAAMAASLFASVHAFAASSADISVVGTIEPAACDIVLTARDIGLGSIKPSQLVADAVSEHGSKFSALAVTCGAATRFALQAVDANAGTAYDTSPTSFGLGMSPSDEKIGYFTLRFRGDSLSGNGANVVGLVSSDQTTWSPAPTSPGDGGQEGPALYSDSQYLAFGEAGSNAVKSLTTFGGTLDVRTFIAPSNELTLGSGLTIAGAATIEVVYL